MYHKKHSHSNKKSGRSRRKKYKRRSRHRIKSFDPTSVVKNAHKQRARKTFKPQHQFSDFKIANSLKKNIQARGYQDPTEIQDLIIPHILKGRDAIGIANTGTGKTAAFLIPLINKVLHNADRVLVMTPTRELAIQIQSEFKLFTKNLGLNSTLCIGGNSIKRQIHSLKTKPDFVIGTPGRLIDLNKRRKLDYRKFTTIVLDEVDEMLNMGFIHDMKYVIKRLPRKRHSLFFSATLPHKLDSVVNQFVHNPVKVKIESHRAPSNVKQDIVKINGKSKVGLLNELLDQEGFDKVLVFNRTRRGTNKLSRKLQNRGFRVAAIHGNKSQNQRRRALKKFRNDVIQILVATDVASRGLDIDNVTHVINYDLPQSYEVYIHRIGRTGRANKTGVALSFVE